MTNLNFIFLTLALLAAALEPASSFSQPRTINQVQSSTVLCAKKAAKKKARPSTSGFGGAAAESCPCGSGDPYMKCCGVLHKKLNAFMKATPEQVVRARYTAYAKREIDFIIKSTHPKNKSFEADISHWRCVNEIRQPNFVWVTLDVSQPQLFPCRFRPDNK